MQMKSVSKCVGSVVERIWDAAGCIEEFQVEECELTWKIWKMVENCVWKPMTRVVGCFVEKAKEVGSRLNWVPLNSRNPESRKDPLTLCPKP